MARKVNTSFTGSTDKQTDPGSYTDEAIIENAVGDTALIHDMLTGDNSPSTTINHTGSGAGVPLGLPLGNSAVIVSGRGSSGTLRRVSSYSSSVVNNAFLFLIPFYLPEGEDTVWVSIDINDGEDLRLVVKNTSWADSGTPTENQFEANRWVGKCTSLTGGTQYILGVKTELGPLVKTKEWTGVRIFFPSSPIQEYETPSEITDAAFTSAPVASQAGASSSTIIDQEDWDAALFAKNRAINAQLTTRLNENQNALAEFLTGSPAGGNDSYTLVSSAGDDPASSAFHDHSISTHTNEGEIDFVVTAVPLGAVESVSGSNGANYVTDNWGAPAATSTGKSVLASDLVQMPDFPDGTSTSNLRCFVVGTYPSSKATVTAHAVARGETAGAGTEQSVVFSQMGTTAYYQSTIGTNTNRLDFGGGEVNELRISITDTSSTQADALRIVGYCWYFDRDL